jgi:hypothetical protein
MNKKSCREFGIWILDFGICLFLLNPVYSQPIIIDHTSTNIYQVPVTAIENAKSQLHIGYGHTSHGSQITDGMSGLVGFMNGKDGYPDNLFAWNHDGSNGALHLYEGDGYGSGDLDHDAGYDTSWVAETREYLGVPDLLGRGSNHPEMNIIIWSWCGQLSGYDSNTVAEYYLNQMNQLELDYSGVKFVYMTGHADGSGLEGDLHINNQQIRQYCIANNKILYDFYDIECYDPDGDYFGDKHVTDNCDYDGGGNWALEWQVVHTEGVDWYDCSAAHSQALNGNRKAYAAWWLWARLAGWDGQTTGLANPDNAADIPAGIRLEQNYPNPFNPSTKIQFTMTRTEFISLEIFNLCGQRVATLVEEEREAGIHTVNFDASNLASGIYFYWLQAGNFSQVRRLTVLK